MPLRILIIRSSAIGDVVFASALPAVIRAAHPEAYIAWLVDPQIAPLIAADPCLDEIIPWSKSAWVKLWQEGRRGELWSEIRALRKALVERRFDLALDLQGLMKSGLLTRLSGAPRRVGLGSREGSQWLMTERIPRGGAERRIGSEYQHLAAELGFAPGEFLPRLFVAEHTAARAAALRDAHGLAPGRYAVLAPFTTRPQKHWFEDAWEALLPRLRGELGLVPVILGGPAERAAAGRIAASSPDVISLAGQTGLAEAAALIREAALVIGVDTGLTHMGIAFATPTVALFGSTRPYLDTGRANARVIWLGLECSPCRRRPTCDGAFTCLREIHPERVLAEARRALAA